MITLEISILQRKRIRVYNPLYFSHATIFIACSTKHFIINALPMTNNSYVWIYLNASPRSIGVPWCFQRCHATRRIHVRRANARRAFARLTSRAIVRKTIIEPVRERVRAWGCSPCTTSPRHARARLIRRPALRIAELEIIRETRAHDNTDSLTCAASTLTRNKSENKCSRWRLNV